MNVAVRLRRIYSPACGVLLRPCRATVCGVHGDPRPGSTSVVLNYRTVADTQIYFGGRQSRTHLRLKKLLCTPLYALMASDYP